MKQPKVKRITVLDMAIIGMMVTIIVVSKEMLSFIANVELVSFWIIIFSIYFGWRIAYVVPIFVLIQGMLYGMGIWWVMYLYIWPMLALLAYLFRKQKSVLFWSILSGFYGLIFGLLCAIPYVVIGAVGKGIRGGLYAGFTWWIAGIPMDIRHCIGNFVLMLILYHPVRMGMNKVMKILNLPPHCSSQAVMKK